jgi:hypothetical protein
LRRADAPLRGRPVPNTARFSVARCCAALLIASALAACASAGGSTSPRPGSARPDAAGSVVLGERYRSDRRGALRRFQPARPAVDSGGECVVRESPMPGTRLLAGYFPNRAQGEVLVSLTVDSAGRVLQYDERRGLLQIPGMARATTPAARDSAVAAAERGTRITEIWLDRVTGEARAINRGGGKPSEGVFGTVAEFETSRQLGRPGTRALRVVDLCRHAS